MTSKKLHPDWHIFEDGKYHWVVTIQEDDGSVKTYIDGKLVGTDDQSFKGGE